MHNGGMPPEPHSMDWQLLLPRGREIEWVAAPLDLRVPDGRPVLPGDRGMVIDNAWPIDLVVSFEASGTFCAKPTEVRRIDGGDAT